MSVAQALFAFMVAYACFLLFLYRADPRFSLKYKKMPSFHHLLLTSTVGTSIFVAMLIVLNVYFGNDLIVAFAIDSTSLGSADVLLGFVSGAGLVLLLLLVDALVSALRHKFLGRSETRREQELKRIIFGSMPRSQKQAFTLLAITSAKAAFFEELIFRGYLLTNLMLMFPTPVSIVAQAVFFFIPHLYQGVYNAVMPFTLGITLGFVFYLTGSLTVVMICHFVADIILLSVQAVALEKGRLQVVSSGELA